MRARADVSGPGRSIPTRTQVPADTKTVPGLDPPGIPRNAEAVSWLPTRFTGTPRHVPAAVPAPTTGGKRDGSNDSSSRRSAAHSPVRMSMSAVVETLERSAASRPVRWWTRRSGRRRIRGGPSQLSGVVRGQLENGVDRHHLDTGALIETFQPDSLGRRLPPFCSGVPVREREVDESPGPIDQPVVDSPAVDTDRRDVPGGESPLEAGLDLRHDSGPIPTQGPVARPDRGMLPPMEDLDRWLLRRQVDGSHADRCGSEIHRQDPERAAHSPVATEARPRSSIIARR